MTQEIAVKVLVVTPKVFDSADGEAISYNECWFLSENETGREVFKLNTKLDLSKHVDENVVILVDYDASGTKKPKIVKVV